MRRRRAVLASLAVASIASAAGAGWLLTPPDEYSDELGLVHNQQFAWEIPTGLVLLALAAGALLLMWRETGAVESTPQLVVGLIAPLAAAAFLVTVGLRGSSREVVGSDIGSGLYLLFAIPLLLSCLVVAVTTLTVIARRGRRG